MGVRDVETYPEIAESVMDLYVTPEIDPVSPSVALMRIPNWQLARVVYCSSSASLPLTEFFTSLFENVMVLTVLSERPPTEPMDKPWPPEQTVFSTVID